MKLLTLDMNNIVYTKVITCYNNLFFHCPLMTGQLKLKH